MADKKFNLKDQLAGIAALIAAIVAIGGGFAKYGELNERINTLTEASKTVDSSIVAVLEEKVTKLSEIEGRSSTDYSAQIAVLEEKVAAIESHEHNMAEHGHTKILVNEKQIELLQVQIEEIKVSTSNPLAN